MELEFITLFLTSTAIFLGIGCFLGKITFYKFIFITLLCATASLGGTIYTKFGLHLSLVESQNFECKILEQKGVYTRGPEDVLKYNSTYLIVTSSDLFKLWEIGQYTDAEQGSIFFIKNFQASQELIQPKMIDFPKNVTFHPHGGYIRREDDMLFVINHSYETGNGDRIEVFKINFNNHTLTYKNSILFPMEFNGVLNNLIVTQKGNIYVTKYLATADPLNGRQNKSTLANLEYIIHVLFSIKKTHVYKCTFEENWSEKPHLKPNCTQQTETSSIMANGITWDGKETVYLADCTSRCIKRFNINKDQLAFTGQIQLPFAPDNVEYDPETGRLNTAGPLKAMDHISYIEHGRKIKGRPEKVDEFWCGVGYVDSKSFNFTNIATFKNNITGCTSAHTTDKRLYIGSWSDRGVLQCDKK